MIKNFVEILVSRNVRASFAGEEAYVLRTKTMGQFQYGKGHAFKTGKEAIDFAVKEAKGYNLDENSRVEVIHWRGSKGKILMIKDSNDLVDLDFNGQPISGI